MTLFDSSLNQIPTCYSPTKREGQPSYIISEVTQAGSIDARPKSRRGKANYSAMDTSMMLDIVSDMCRIDSSMGKYVKITYSDWD